MPLAILYSIVGIIIALLLLTIHIFLGKLSFLMLQELYDVRTTMVSLPISETQCIGFGGLTLIFAIMMNIGILFIMFYTKCKSLFLKPILYFKKLKTRKKDDWDR